MVAGFDPATFWKLTPRHYHQRMKAAKQCATIAQARTAEATWFGMRSDADGLGKYIDHLTGLDRRLPVEALGSTLAAASAGVPIISRADFLKMKGSHHG
jgi:hypothetical protein